MKPGDDDKQAKAGEALPAEESDARPAEKPESQPARESSVPGESRASTAVEAQRATKVADQMRTRITAALKPDGDRKVDFNDLIVLSGWRELESQIDAPKRDIADEYYMDAVTAYKASHPGCRLAFLEVGAVLLDGIGEKLRVIWLFRRIHFDSTDARALIDRIDAISDAAMEWWRDEDPAPNARAANGGVARRETATSEQGRRRGRGRGLRRNAPRQAPAHQRQPHLARAYELATGVVAAAANEEARHVEQGTPPTDGNSRRSITDADTVSDMYKRELAELAKRIDRAEALLEAAGQRTAQSLYARGMFHGILLLGLVTLVGGLSFLLFDTPAKYGIGLPAGGLGAFVSVFQRMGRKGYKLDMEPTSELVRFGRVRPFIGAIFGLVIMALLESGVLSIPHDGSSLALYAALGFFAGFNERFAPDKLTSAALIDRRGESSVGPAAPA